MIKSKHQKIFLMIKKCPSNFQQKNGSDHLGLYPPFPINSGKKEGLRVEDLLQRRWGVILVVTDNWEGWVPSPNHTLPETNITPEKRWLEDENSFWDGLFSEAKRLVWGRVSSYGRAAASCGFFPMFFYGKNPWASSIPHQLQLGRAGVRNHMSNGNSIIPA